MQKETQKPIHETTFWQAIARPGFLRFLIAFSLIMLIAWVSFSFYQESRQEARAGQIQR